MSNKELYKKTTELNGMLTKNKKELTALLNRMGFLEKVMSSFEISKREDFVPEKYKQMAYFNISLELEKNSTISQPSTIEFMLTLLNLSQNQSVLEIGSGSGYCIDRIKNIIKGGKIYAYEISKELTNKSREYFKDNENIKIFNQDGYNGLTGLARKYTPVNRILASVAYNKMPEHLYDQLTDPGVLVVPVDNGTTSLYNGQKIKEQSIFKITRNKGKIIKEEYPEFSFVPMVRPHSQRTQN
jgi:protein-L-isoaspartate(D-aspartate) O-methyltransferase